MVFENFINLLKDLKENAKPHWGKMTPQHMVEQLVIAVQSSNGKITFNECMNTQEKFPALKRFLMSPRSLPRNFVNTLVGEGLKPLVF